MNLSELLSAAAAVSELHDSLIELGGIDAALAAGAGGYDRGPGIRTFFNLPQNLGTLSHPVFAPANVSVDWRDEIKAGCNEILAAFNR